MAATETVLIPLGFEAPHFSLPDVVSGKHFTLNDLKGVHGTWVMFICNHCPYVIHIRAKLIEMAREYQQKGIGIVCISSNDVENYPDDSPEKMRDLAVSENWPFPYLYDESQAVAKAYIAACTPDFSVFDADLKCVYRGQFDTARPKNTEPVTGNDMRRALDTLLHKQPIPEPQIPSIGCNIKWKK